jgi:hypothetical protein
MANPSPFLRYQDKNGDFLIDDCETDLPGPIEKVCLDCKPNPKAIVQNWKTNLGFPFLNEKLCLYQVGIQTPHMDTGGESGIKEKFESYKEDAIELFLDEYQKAANMQNIETLRKEIIYDSSKDFYLEPRANSRLSLLFSVPFSVLENLEADDGDSDDEDDQREPVEVSYLASELPIILTRVRKGLNLYQRYVQYHSVINSSTLMFEETRSVFDFDKYGDSGFGNKSQLARVLNELDRFLNQRGFNIAGAGTFGFGKDRVVKLTLGFDRKYKLKKLAVYSIGCREKPKVFKGRKIAALNRIAVFKDPTAMAYFASLSDIERDLTARRPKNFIDLIEEYTYPSVAFFSNREIGENDPSCVGEAIKNTVQGIGQDLLDEALSIGDIIAYRFHETNCRTDAEENELLRQFGQVYQSPEELALIGATKKKRKKNEKEGKESKKGLLGRDSRQAMKAVATQQALETLETNPNIYVQMCGQMLAGLGTNPDFNARDLWNFNLDQIKLCGMFDFLLDGLGCLWGGLQLEDALSIALESALKAMGLQNFGSLFAGLPPSEQAELDKIVKRRLAQIKQQSQRQPSARPTTVNGEPQQPQDNVDVSEDEGFFAGAIGEINFVRPFEDPILLQQEEAARTAGTYGGTTVSDNMYEAQSNNFGIRPRIGTTYTSSQQISGRQTPATDAVKSLDKRAEQTFSKNVIMEAYVLALIEYYSGRLLDLVDKLNDFPGAEIISKLFATLDCPRPPLFTPSVMDFIKDIELPFCRNIGDITAPKLFIPKINLADLWKRLLQAIKEAIVQAVIQIIIKLMVKICEVIGDAICKALQTAGNIIGSLPELLTGNTALRDIVRESICGPNASESDVDDSIASMFSTLGGAGANFANKDRTLAFNETIASSSTRQEIIDASLGNPSQDFLNIVDTIVEYQFPEFREAMPNSEAIRSFFSNFGNFLPPEVKAQLSDISNETYENLDLPANPTLCATPDQVEEFCSLRSQILEGRASDAQIAQLCSLPTEDFATLNDVLQDGIPATIMNNLPPLVSDPGCDNGLFNREPEDVKNLAVQGLSSDLQNLKIAYSRDMLGNGPGFGPFGDANWGYMNMVLSDTMGKPFTTHTTLANFPLGPKAYVDFYTTNDEEPSFDLSFYLPEKLQRGAFPVYVGEWATDYWNNGQDVYQESGDNSITLRYRDNAEGTGESSYSDDGMILGYDVNVDFDTSRTIISRRINQPNFRSIYGLLSQMPTEGENEEPTKSSDDPKIISDTLYRFSGLDGDLSELLNMARRGSGNPDYLINFEQEPTAANLMIGMFGSSRSEADNYIKTTTARLITEFGKKIYNLDNESFLYGARPDALTSELTEYGVVVGGDFVPYAESDYTNEDTVLGLSRDQYNNEQAGTPEKTRVFYVDPEKYGGSYTTPKVYVKPSPAEGMLGLVNVLFPELGPCKPSRTDLVDFSDIEQKIANSYNNYPDDPRLAGDPDCIVERPFDRVLPRSAKSGLEGVISAACRIYASIHLLKTINTFSVFKPDFKNVLDPMYALYVIEDMADGFKDSQGGLAELFNPFKDDEFWYAFLEQTVQVYYEKIQSGAIVDVPADVEEAFERIARVQNRYSYPSKKDLKLAKALDEVTIFKNIDQFREDKNLEAVQVVERACKVILKEYMIEEMNFISEALYKNMKAEGFIKDNYVENMYYYILSDLTFGSQLDLDKELREEVASPITAGQSAYTNGDEFALEDGTPYVGYYHAMEDDEGDLVFMVGEEHGDDDRLLRPFANKVIVPIGDIDGVSGNSTAPFKIRKYIRRNLGAPEEYSTELIEQIRSDGGDRLVSEVYPGTLQYVYDGQKTREDFIALDPDAPGRRVVGLQGELGLRYGLEFSTDSGGVIATAEIDVLDLPLSLLKGLEGNSKELLCLVNKLVDDPKFQLFFEYGIPVRKMLSTIAIYNDVSYLQSIGQITRGKKVGDKDDKPGSKYEDGEQIGKEGWFPKRQRLDLNPIFTTWDEWDKQTLRKSNAVLKKMFKSYYYSRDFGKQDEPEFTGAQVAIQNLKEKFKFAPGARSIPFWNKKISSPLNAKGQVCESKDED